MERLAGTYAGKAADGAPVTLVLSPDGRYTAKSFVSKDWLTGKRIPVEPEGDWQVQVDDQWDIPLVDEDPPHARVVIGNGSDLDVGGTLAAPVLYDADESSDRCETLPNVLRRTG